MATRKLAMTMPAYSALFLPSGKNLDRGDKIILPDSVLKELLTRWGDRPLPHPLIFQVRNMSLNRTSHCGVLEFTAIQYAAFMPNWMLENLLLSDGAPVRLEIRSLPKLTFVKLQPTQYAFTQIHNPKAALEEALHKFTALTRGDTILIQHHNDEFLLNVIEVGPSSSSDPPAGCVVDTNVEVAFDEPLEEAPAEDVITPFEMDALEEGHVEADQFAYYRVKAIDEHMAIRFELEARCDNTCPDMYISTSVNKPSPTQSSWFGTTKKPVTIEPTPETSSSHSWFYIAVHSYGVPTAFSLSVTHVEPSKSKQGQSLANNLNSQVEQDPDSIKCDNCLRYIPKLSYAMHGIMCARNNWACQQCGQVLPKRDRAQHHHCELCQEVVPECDMPKHLDLFHLKVRCKCGSVVEAMFLATHQSDECAYRMLTCKFCDQKVPANQQDTHQKICGARTIPCEICGDNVTRLRMTLHMATVHQINPCIDSMGNRNLEESSSRASCDLSRLVASTQQSSSDNEASILAAAIAASRESAFVTQTNSNLVPLHMDEDEQLARALAASQQSPTTTTTHTTSMQAHDISTLSLPITAQIPSSSSMFNVNENNSNYENAIAASLSSVQSNALFPTIIAPPMRVGGNDIVSSSSSSSITAATAAATTSTTTTATTTTAASEFDIQMEAAIQASLREFHDSQDENVSGSDTEMDSIMQRERNSNNDWNE